MGVKEIRAQLRQRIADGPILIVPGTGDALGARLVQQAGFEAVYVSGFCVEASYGLPDVGFLGMSEVAERAGQIAAAVDLPVFCDCDTGYGSTVNILRTVREFERAGVAAVQFEDQALPKKCGSMAGKQLVTTTEMVGKIKAAVDTREDPNLLIIGRTDAIAIDGADAAFDRISQYAEAGADLLMVTGPYDETVVKRLAEGLSKPLVYLNSESLTMPMIPVPELDKLGIAIVAFPLSLLLSATRAMANTLDVIRQEGTTLDAIKPSMVSWNEFNEIVGLPKLVEWERQFN